MSDRDNIHLPKVQLENGNTLEEGWYETNLNEIGAVYKVTEEGIVVSDNGSLTGYGDLDMLSEAPEHYDIKTGSFTGSIELEDGTVIEFKNNQISNAVRV